MNEFSYTLLYTANNPQFDKALNAFIGEIYCFENLFQDLKVDRNHTKMIGKMCYLQPTSRFSKHFIVNSLVESDYKNKTKRCVDQTQSTRFPLVGWWNQTTFH